MIPDIYISAATCHNISFLAYCLVNISDVTAHYLYGNDKMDLLNDQKPRIIALNTTHIPSHT